MSVIRIPYDWTPRPHQLPACKYLEGGGKRAVLVWHRRTGKASTAGNWLAITLTQHASLSSYGLPGISRRQRLPGMTWTKGLVWTQF